MIYYCWTNIKSKHAGQELKVSQMEENVSTGWERFVPALCPCKWADHALLKHPTRPARFCSWAALSCAPVKILDSILVREVWYVIISFYLCWFLCCWKLERHQCCSPGSRARSCCCLWRGDLISEQPECSAVKQRGIKIKVTWPVFVCMWKMLYKC